MNTYEERAWRRLVELGAREQSIGGKPSLDLTACRPRGGEQIADLIDAIIQVSGNSRSVRRHQDRKGRLVYVVADQAPLKRRVGV